MILNSLLSTKIQKLLLLFLCMCATCAPAQQTLDTIQRQRNDSATTLLMDTLTLKHRAMIAESVHRIIEYLSKTNIDKSAQKFDISFVGGPSYEPDTKLGVAVLAQALYRTNRKDLTIEPSNVAMYANFSTSGFISVGAYGVHIWQHDKYRINYQTEFSYLPTRYYGIGYRAGLADHYTKYDEVRAYLTSNIIRRVFKNAYAGLTFDAETRHGQKFRDLELKPSGALGTTIVGPGYIVTYDSRDFIPNPTRGIYLKYQQSFFIKPLGSSVPFNRVEITARTYKQIRKGTILAFDLNGIFNNGDTPWNELSQLGTSRTMRGYYTGQYRDKKQLNTQVEWRQHLWGRNGFAVWVGAGNVFPSFDKWKWSETLPDYGLGYRWEFKHHVNARLDYGFGKRQSGFYLAMQEAF